MPVSYGINGIRLDTIIEATDIIPNMPNKTVFIFGNAELKNDSLPIKLIPQLQKAFPDISFELKDPNEEWDIPTEMMIIDTVVGPKDVAVFDDIEKFDTAPRLTMHDFDALANLHYMKKLGKLKKIKIIGVPPKMSQKKALEAIGKILRELKK